MTVDIRSFLLGTQAHIHLSFKASVSHSASYPSASRRPIDVQQTAQQRHYNQILDLTRSDEKADLPAMTVTETSSLALILPLILPNRRHYPNFLPKLVALRCACRFSASTARALPRHAVPPNRSSTLQRKPSLSNAYSVYTEPLSRAVIYPSISPTQVIAPNKKNGIHDPLANYGMLATELREKGKRPTIHSSFS